MKSHSPTFPKSVDQYDAEHSSTAVDPDDPPADDPADRATYFSGAIKNPHDFLKESAKELEHAVFSTNRLMQSFKSTWIERGFSPTDPAFIIFEGISHWDNKILTIAKAHAEMIKASANMTEQNTSQLADLAPEIARTNSLLLSLLDSLPQTTRAYHEISKVTPKLADSLAACLSQLNEKSIQAAAIRIAAGVALLVIGVVIGKILF